MGNRADESGMESGIAARKSAYLGTHVQVGYAGGKVISVSFPSTPDDGAVEADPLLDRLVAYFEGVEDDFADVDVGLTVPTAHRSVLEAVREVPYGTQVSVAELVGMSPGMDPDDDDDLTDAREALAENPVPILVPDHRVRDGPSGAPPEIEQKLRSLEGL